MRIDMEQLLTDRNSYVPTRIEVWVRYGSGTYRLYIAHVTSLTLLNSNFFLENLDIFWYNSRLSRTTTIGVFTRSRIAAHHRRDVYVLGRPIRDDVSRWFFRPRRCCPSTSFSIFGTAFANTLRRHRLRSSILCFANPFQTTIFYTRHGI